jgi:hypothetical protein
MVMRLNLGGSIVLAAMCASSAYAGDPLIDLHVTIGAFQTDTDVAGGFTVTGLKPGNYDVIYGGAHITLKINGKRVPLACSPDGCKGKAVPLSAGAKGRVALT